MIFSFLARLTARLLSVFRGVCQKLAHGQQVRYASLLATQPRKSSQNTSPCPLLFKFLLLRHCEILRSKIAAIHKILRLVVIASECKARAWQSKNSVFRVPQSVFSMENA